MKQYLNYLRNVYENGRYKANLRTGIGTKTLIGQQMRFDLSYDNLPVITTKYIHLKSLIHELLWMLSGDTNIKYLQENGVTIWDEWADKNGELGPVYGAQWRRWKHAELDPKTNVVQTYCIDQMAEAVAKLQTDPTDRGIIVNSWNVGELPRMALRPCHCMFQFVVIDNLLTCHLTQRSCDSFLGVPFNITFYALLTHMVARHTGLIPHELVWEGVDCHIYENHFEQVLLQLTREPLETPKIKFNRLPLSLFDYKYEDIEIINYKHHSKIKGAVAI